MANDKRTGTAIPAGILRPTTQLEDSPRIEGQGGESPPAGDEAAAPEGKVPRRTRSKKTVTALDVKLEGRRIYLSEGVHFRLRMAAYQRGKKISEVAEEVLDKGLPRYDVNRVG